MTASLTNRLNRLLLDHSARYPHLQVQDVYKLLYQAAMGSGHVVPNAARAQAWLEEEICSLAALRPKGFSCKPASPLTRQLRRPGHLSSMQTFRVWPLVEQISPEAELDRRVVRVHLCPYLAATANMQPLLGAFVRTANAFEGSTQRLEQYAALVSQIPAQAGLPFLISDFENFMTDMRSQDYPAVHHSESYIQHYQPAYRVVAARFLAPILAVCRGE